MYNMARCSLTLGLLALFYCVAVLVAMTAPLSLIGVIAILLGLVRKRRIPLTAHGTARWSEENALRRAGMTGVGQGLILGRLPGNPKWRFCRAIGRVLDNRIPAPEACRRFLEVFRKRAGKEHGELVGLRDAVHTAVFAPTGVGKGVSCVIPFLLTCEESCVVIDFKGELSTLTAEHRRRMGHEVVILDPYKVVTQ